MKRVKARDIEIVNEEIKIWIKFDVRVLETELVVISCERLCLPIWGMEFFRGDNYVKLYCEQESFIGLCSLRPVLYIFSSEW